MSREIICPNCEAAMDEGDSCPECNHNDGDRYCECDWCIKQDGDDLNDDSGI